MGVDMDGFRLVKLVIDTLRLIEPDTAIRESL